MRAFGSIAYQVKVNDLFNLNEHFKSECTCYNVLNLSSHFSDKHKVFENMKES